MCSTGPFQYKRLKGFIYSSCYYHYQIGSIHLSHCYPIFPWLCVWDVCCIIFCYLLHIHSGKTGKLFSLFLCSLWWVQIIGYVLSRRSYSLVCTLHHLISIIVQTYLKTLNLYCACQIYFVECVSKIRHILSVIHYTIRGAGCVFSVYPFPCDEWENIYTLYYYHHHIGTMDYYPFSRVRSCMSFGIHIGVITEIFDKDYMKYTFHIHIKLPLCACHEAIYQQNFDAILQIDVFPDVEP